MPRPSQAFLVAEDAQQLTEVFRQLPTDLITSHEVVEISVAFSILIAFIVIGVFLFRIRERFDSVDIGALDDYRGERR